MNTQENDNFKIDIQFIKECIEEALFFMSGETRTDLLTYLNPEHPLLQKATSKVSYIEYLKLMEKNGFIDGKEAGLMSSSIHPDVLGDFGPVSGNLLRFYPMTAVSQDTSIHVFEKKLYTEEMLSENEAFRLKDAYNNLEQHQKKEMTYEDFLLAYMTSSLDQLNNLIYQLKVYSGGDGENFQPITIMLHSPLHRQVAELSDDMQPFALRPAIKPYFLMITAAKSALQQKTVTLSFILNPALARGKEKLKAWLIADIVKTVVSVVSGASVNMNVFSSVSPVFISPTVYFDNKELEDLTMDNLFTLKTRDRLISAARTLSDSLFGSQDYENPPNSWSENNLNEE